MVPASPLLRCILPAFLICGVAAYAQPPAELRIGAVISMTGGAAALGVNAANAVKLLEEHYATSELPYRVRIVMYDDGTDPTRAVNAVRRAMQEDRVHAVLCCTTTPNSMAVIPVVQREQVPMISMALAASIVEPPAERHFVFKTAVTDHLMVARVVDDMVKRGFKRVAFLGLEDAYGEGGWAAFQQVTKAQGLEVVASERFSRTDTNFTPQALKIRQRNVYFHAIPPSAALAQEAVHRVGFRGLVYQSGGSANQAFLNVGQATVQGTVVAVQPMQVYDQMPSGNPLVPVLRAFAQAFDAKYGQGKADQYAGYGWDATRLVVAGFDALHRTGHLSTNLAATRLALRDAIERVHDYFGVSGVFNFTPQNHLGLDHRAIYLTQVRDGSFQLIED